MHEIREKMEVDNEVTSGDDKASIHEASVTVVPPDSLQRKLKERHIQFIAIGGTCEALFARPC